MVAAGTDTVSQAEASLRQAIEDTDFNLKQQVTHGGLYYGDCNLRRMKVHTRRQVFQVRSQIGRIDHCTHVQGDTLLHVLIRVGHTSLLRMLVATGATAPG